MYFIIFAETHSVNPFTELSLLLHQGSLGVFIAVDHAQEFREIIGDDHPISHVTVTVSETSMSSGSTFTS